ncbi:zinc ribbon domain-containing protein [Halobaculum sp. CBA1158]|uniref:double zinc ribbon domain-containing protein n=1 Tax=Halobaculum sp. CBA1158 TaxID=2904243 RepID=UPI001F3E7267|nr:zinc ribbon domain-containing protein [Halobaculum sp. CBA1158]UIP00484.1 zinc ribbon domain-containing protein [Halobaculum sp. CBA1158]
MSKITFRADSDLVDRLDEFEASKSEVMREALRAYLDDAERRDAVGSGSDGVAEERSPLDDALAARVDELVTARLDEEFGTRRGDRGGYADRGRPSRTPRVADTVPSVDLTVNVDGVGAGVDGPADGDETTATAPNAPATTANDGSRSETDRETEAAAGTASDADSRSCAQCGEDVSDDHVFCPNCGEKATRRLFCECGDEVRSDWGFCPGCGRRTPTADVLDAP